VKSECTGRLFGMTHDGALLVIGLCMELDEECDSVSVEDQKLHFPTEIELCGCVICSDPSQLKQEFPEGLQEVCLMQFLSVWIRKL
jgi:hypothetical protein